MKLALLLAVLAGQTIYEWVDAKGESHFTDDPSSIPRGAKRTEREAEPVPVVKAAPDAGAVMLEQPARPRALPSCSAAQKKVSDLEAQQDAARLQVEAQKQSAARLCNQRLRTHGRPAYALCLAEAQNVPPPMDLGPRLQAAREELRQVQVGGCRD